jgi:class 3 adenylate cyclase
MEAPAPLKKALALVFCDIAGTTRLNAQEGDLVVATMLREFFEQTGRLGTEHHCLTVKFLGDGFLAAFENVENVIPFVFSIQSLLSQNPIFMGRPLAFKFSLHYGNVLYIETSYGKDLVGEEVNVAARLNDLAQPNEVVVSQVALDRMPTDYRARAGASETYRFMSSREFKGVGNVKFRRVNLLTS